MIAPPAPLLDVRDLNVRFRDPSGGTFHVIDGLGLRVSAGESVGIVGESGSGKSVLARTIMGLQPPGFRPDVTGSILFDGSELIRMPTRTRRRRMAGAMSMIFQDPSSSLNPVVRIGNQILEGAVRGRPSTPHERRDLVRELLGDVGITDPDRLARAYPSELSGGQRQRVGIETALAGHPRLLLADEPTTALDASVQRRVLDLIDRLRAARGLAMILITHDLGVVAGRTDRIAVMYAGRIVETGRTRDVLSNPAHPYTRALIDVRPSLTRPRPLPFPQIAGSVPPLDQPHSGCPFAPRCVSALPRCGHERPPAGTVREGEAHEVACWNPVDGRSETSPRRATEAAR